MKRVTIAVAVLAALTFAVATVRGQQPGKEHAELAKALNEAKISLQRGLTASAKEGKPISAKYEIEHDQLQLSVYTMKGGKFSEVIVDHKTGKVANWACEMGSPNGLTRQGWTRNTLKVGMVVSLEGTQAKDGSSTANARNVTVDGKKLGAGSSEAVTP